MENFIIALGCVTPMFIVLCIGLLLRRSNVVPVETFRHMSTMTFYALLPFVIFNNVYSADLSTAAQPRLLIFLIGSLLLWYLFSFCTFRRIEPDRRRQGALIQNSYRSNIAVIGLSLAQNMMSQDGLAILAIAISIMVPLYNTLAVVTLELCRGGKIDLKKLIFNVLRNPMIIGCLAGFAFLLLGIRLPNPVERAVSNLSTTGSLMAQLSLGASLELSSLKRNRATVFFGCFYRLILTPFLAIAAALLLGYRGDAIGIVLVCMGTPTAAASFPMAVAYDSDHELTSQFVVCTSLFCSLTLFLWVFVLKQLGIL